MPDPESIPPQGDEPRLVDGEEGGARGFVADAVRKAVQAGLGAFLVTEEGARKLARDWKLPKEIAAYVTAQAGSAKDEIVRVISDEVRKFFQSEALRREFLRLVSSMAIEVRAEISLKPAAGARVEPELKSASVKPKVKRPRGEGHAEGPKDPAPAKQ